MGFVMMRRVLSGLLLSISVLGGCDSYDPANPVVPPPRPISVPASASWAGGMDGGNWFDCKIKSKKYECVIYTDYDESGYLISKGEYSISFKSEPSVCKQVVVDEKLIFSGQGYGEILLENDFDLKADGIIDNPPSVYPNVTGIKQRFRCGEEVGNKEEYLSPNRS